MVCLLATGLHILHTVITHLMKKIFYILTILISSIVYSQNGILQSIQGLNIETMTDAQIESYWASAKSQGYSIDDLEALAKLQGVSSSTIEELRNRINSLNSVTSPNLTNISASNIKDTSSLNPKSNVEINKDSEIFGFDFFNNSNISFEPNLYLPTPKNYQIGPQDELMISVWGAAENNYKVKVNPDGSIRIPNVGPIFISGMPIDLATKKITGSLKAIYAGINLSNSSANKVYVDISLTNVRRVQIDLIGEVKVPGTYSLSALSTVMNALYAAGGPNVNGTFRNILHTRNGIVIGNLDIYDYLLNGSVNSNNTLRDQDVIIVRPFKKRIELKGEIKRPGKFELKRGETFSDLLEYSGGFTSRAFKDVISVVRVDSGQLAIKDIEVGDTDLLLQDGDQIRVSGIINDYKNKVSIAGGVNKPGSYELDENLKLTGLIKKSFGVSKDAFLDRGILYRNVDGVNTIAKPFSVKDVLDGVRDIKLVQNDSVYIFTKGYFGSEAAIEVLGAVNRPKKIPYVDSLSIKDAIAIAGGFKIGANPGVVDVTRIMVDNDYDTESEQFTKSITTNFKISPNDDSFYLKPSDRIVVRYLKGYGGLKEVQVRGEVQYPGKYFIKNKNDRVSDLLDNAGGLSPYAYLKGATLQRSTQKNKLEEQSATIKNITLADSIVNNDPAVSRVNLNLDLNKILNGGKGSKYDLILEPDDVLSIPSEKQTVQIKGEILAPSIVRYDKSLSLKDYVNNSGGFTNNAKKNKAYVVYPNGQVQATKNFLFFRNYPQLEPGAVILIPPKPERANKLTLQETISITTGLGALALIIDRLSN